MNDPKKSVSDDRNTQNPSFQVFSPVAVGGWSACASVCAMVSSSREAGPAPGPEARAGCLPAVLCVPVRGPVRLNARDPPFALGPGPLARSVYVGSYAQFTTPTNVHAIPISGSHHEGAMNSTQDRVTPTAVKIGQYEFGGMCIGSGSPRASFSICSASTQSGSRLCTVGIFAKLYSRGGDSVAPSSVAACHGFGPAFWPRFRLRITFVKSMITPIAWMNAPAVTSWFSPSRLRSAP